MRYPHFKRYSLQKLKGRKASVFNQFLFTQIKSSLISKIVPMCLPSDTIRVYTFFTCLINAKNSEGGTNSYEN